MFTWVNTMLGNAKNTLDGIYQAATKKLVGRHLGAFAYQFNRRFELGSMIERLTYCRFQSPGGYSNWLAYSASLYRPSPYSALP